MKNSDEIKKGITACVASACEECAYFREENCVEKRERDTFALIQQLESRLAQIDDGILALFGTYSQLSKALCGKENAKSEELLQESNQLKDRLAKAERMECGGG